MTQEEKAKAYDEALKVLHKYDGANIMFSQSLKEEMFPELKESEDERIRKELISFFTERAKYTEDSTFGGLSSKEILAWLKKQGEQKPANWFKELEDKLANATPKQLAEWKEKYFKEEPAEWSEEDESIMNAIYKFLDGSDALYVDQQQAKYWLRSIKDRVQPQPKQEWKQENTHDLTDFENVMMHIGDSFFGENSGLDPNDTNTIKEQANILLELVPKQEWNKEDEERLKNIISVLDVQVCWDGATGKKGNPYQKEIDWLKSIRPQTQWKPSDEQIKALKEACNEHWEPDGLDPLYTLYQNLKKLREE